MTPATIEVRVHPVGWYWRHGTLLFGYRIDSGPVRFYRPDLRDHVTDDEVAAWLVDVERVPVDGYRVADTTTTTED